MMRRRWIVVVLGFGLLTGLWAVSGTKAVEDRAGKGVLVGLRVGQPIVLKDLGLVYEVSTLGGALPTGQEIVEVGADFLVVKDVAHVETRIPVTSIKAITRIVVPGR